MANITGEYNTIKIKATNFTPTSSKKSVYISIYSSKTDTTGQIVDNGSVYGNYSHTVPDSIISNVVSVSESTNDEFQGQFIEFTGLTNKSNNPLYLIRDTIYYIAVKTPDSSMNFLTGAFDTNNQSNGFSLQSVNSFSSGSVFPLSLQSNLSGTPKLEYPQTSATMTLQPNHQEFLVCFTTLIR